MKGAYRSTIRVALTEIDQGRSDGDASRSSRGWKLFLLLPRILLHKLPRGGLVPKKQLHRRFESFSEGDWAISLGREHRLRFSSGTGQFPSHASPRSGQSGSEGSTCRGSHSYGRTLCNPSRVGGSSSGHQEPVLLLLRFRILRDTPLNFETPSHLTS